MSELKDCFYLRFSIDGPGGSASTISVSRQELELMSLQDLMEAAAHLGKNAFMLLSLERNCKACGRPLE